MQSFGAISSSRSLQRDVSSLKAAAGIAETIFKFQGEVVVITIVMDDKKEETCRGIGQRSSRERKARA